MAYFRCSLGGGSGNGAVITVTYGAEFYNQTFVATNNVDTVSVVATSSGTVDIDVPSEGSWVVSCTIGADTYTSDTVVVDLTYSTSLTALPDGSTVTPTDDIQTWLACAGITDKAYTLLSEVLADTDTYTTLLGDSNACDYMARSTTWAVAQGTVPTMTGYTTPSGEVFGSSPYSGNELWKAFDGDSSTLAASGTSSTSRQIGYHFTSATSVRMFKYNVDFTTAIDIGISIAYSDDGTNYTTATETFTYTSAQNGTDVLFKLSNDYGSHEYWKLLLTTSANRSNIAYTIQFYSDVDITSDADAMRLLGMYDYACKVLLEDSTWNSAIVGSTYVDYIIGELVPVLSSNTGSNGTAIASTENGTNYAWKAYDKASQSSWNRDGTRWEATSGANEYIGYHFNVPTIVTKISVCSIYVTKQRIKGTVKIEGSNDGLTWNTIHTDTVPGISTGYSRIDTFSFTNTTAYTYYRLFVVASEDSTSKIATPGLQFYGKEVGQTDIIHSAPSDTIYYLDNGSPVTLCTTDASGVGTVDWSDLPTGDITLYSSVAKDPDDLTDDYGKTIKVTKNKTEAWLMPDIEGLLYWYGWESANLEDMTSANGWSRSGYSFSAPTRTTNYLDCARTSQGYSMVTKKNKVGSGTVVKAITEGVTAYNNTYGYILTTASKSISATEYPIQTSALTLNSQTLSSEVYACVGTDVASGSREIKVYAFWLE